MLLGHMTHGLAVAHVQPQVLALLDVITVLRGQAVGGHRREVGRGRGLQDDPDDDADGLDGLGRARRISQDCAPSLADVCACAVALVILVVGRLLHGAAGAQLQDDEDGDDLLDDLGVDLLDVVVELELLDELVVVLAERKAEGLDQGIRIEGFVAAL